MQQVVEGFLENGEIYLDKKINFKFAKVKIFFDEIEKNVKKTNNYLSRNKLRVHTKGFKFNREELYER